MSASSTLTGPGGNSLDRVGTVSVDPVTGAATLAGTFTGPGGRSVSYLRVV